MTSDPIVAAAAHDATAHVGHTPVAQHWQQSVYAYLHLVFPLFFGKLPHPPAWIDWLDHSVLHSDALEAAWRFAGGDDWGMWVNNLGALSTLAAFSMRDLLMLRYLSIAGQICGIAFCFTREPPLWNPIFWQGIFLAVNLYNLVTLLRERYGEVALSRDERDLFERIFVPHGVTPSQFNKLLGCAQWKVVGRGHVVAIEGAAQSDELTSVQLTLVHSGQLAFRAGGETISVRTSKVLPPNFPTGLTFPVTDFLGDFVGDVRRAHAHRRPANAHADAPPTRTPTPRQRAR